MLFLHRLDDVVVGVAHGRGVGDVEAHAAGVALVDEVRRIDLHRDREAELLGEQQRFGRRARDHGLRDGDAEGAQDGLRLHLGEDLAAFLQNGLDQHLGPLRFRAGGRRRRFRRLQQELLVPVVGRDVVVQLDRRFRHAEGRDRCVLHRQARFEHLFLAHPAGQDRLRGLVADVDHRLRDGHRLRHRLRREHHQHAVHVLVLRHRKDGIAVALGRRVAADVDRIAVRPGGRQRRVERLRGRHRQVGERNVEVAGAVGGHRARSAAVGDDGQALALRAELGGQRLRGVEQLADVLDAHDAGAADGGVENDVGAGDHARVGLHGGRAGGVAAGLEQDDRLDARRRAQRAHEAAGVADAFDVKQDVVRAAVVDQVVENLAEIDVGRAAQRNDAGEADAVALRPVEYRGAHGARLRNQREMADVGIDAREGGVQAEFRADDAEAVGAEHAHVVAAGDFEHLAFERGARVAGLGEARGDDDDVLDAAAAALLDDGRHRLRAGGDHRQFDARADLFDRLVGFDALHRLVFGVDRVQAALVARVEDVLEEDVADRIFAVGGADHGDGFGFEQTGQIVLFKHVVSLSR